MTAVLQRLHCCKIGAVLIVLFMLIWCCLRDLWNTFALNTVDKLKSCYNKCIQYNFGSTRCLNVNYSYGIRAGPSDTHRLVEACLSLIFFYCVGELSLITHVNLRIIVNHYAWIFHNVTAWCKCWMLHLNCQLFFFMFYRLSVF